MNIAILDDYEDVIRTLDCFRKLAPHNIKVWNDHTEDIDVLTERLKDTDVLVTIRDYTPIRAPLLERLNKLKLVIQSDDKSQVDIDACTRRGVIVAWNGHPTHPSYATAELTLGLMIAAMRQIPQQMASLKSGRWQGGLGFGMRGRILGIFGYGRIGPVIGGYGKALGMKVLVWGREGSLARAQADGHGIAASKETFFEQSDIITLHVRFKVPPSPIVLAADLARMKPTAVIINTSRAGLIEPGALEAALRAGRPGMAGIDVYEKEPITSGGHPLLALSNAICTPHIGFRERDAFEGRFTGIFDLIHAYVAGQPTKVVNPQVLAATQTK